MARAVFIHRLGDIRDRTFEQQRYRASGLSLVTAAIVLWNTVYLERAAQALRDAGSLKDDSLQQYMSPLGYEWVLPLFHRDVAGFRILDHYARGKP